MSDDQFDPDGSTDPPSSGATTGPPDFATARDRVLREVVRFGRTLRRAGASVPANATLPAVAALVEAGLDDRERARAAMHATLVTSPRDRDVFDDHFPTFWYRLRTGLEATATADDRQGDAEMATDDRNDGSEVDGALADPAAREEATAGDTAPESSDGADDLAGDGAEVVWRRVADAGAEDVEGGSDRDDGRSGTYSTAGSPAPVEDEPGAGERLDSAAVAGLEAALASLAGRRWARSRDGEAADVRRALRESLATGGVTVSVPSRERAESAFGACVLVDVSQSVLDAVDRGFLLAVIDALVDDGRDVRVFFFDTDLREVTDAFAGQRGDPAAALERSEVVWGGGTRIGDSLATLRRRWPHAVDRRTPAIVISDGLDVGDVDELERGMAWLARRAGAVVWLNPLAASPRYEPTCRGMAAALPYVDGLFAFGGNDDLREVARQLRRHGASGPVGYEQDFRDRGGVES